MKAHCQRRIVARMLLGVSVWSSREREAMRVRVRGRLRSGGVMVCVGDAYIRQDAIESIYSDHDARASDR